MPGFFLIDGVAHPASLSARPDDRPDDRADDQLVEAVVAVDGDNVWVHFDGRAHLLVWQDAITHYEEEASSSGDDVARAPMPGSVIQISVSAGDTVTAGQVMMIIESMKLETAIKAPRDGTVASIPLAVGQTFVRDAALVTLEETA